METAWRKGLYKNAVGVVMLVGESHSSNGRILAPQNFSMSSPHRNGNKNNSKNVEIQGTQVAKGTVQDEILRPS